MARGQHEPREGAANECRCGGRGSHQRRGAHSNRHHDRKTNREHRRTPSRNPCHRAREQSGGKWGMMPADQRAAGPEVCGRGRCGVRGRGRRQVAPSRRLAWGRPVRASLPEFGKVGECLAAARTCAQDCVGRGCGGKTRRIAAVRAIWVRSRRDPPPRGPHVVIGHISAGGEAEQLERVARPDGCGAWISQPDTSPRCCSAPNTSSSSWLASGSRSSCGAAGSGRRLGATACGAPCVGARIRPGIADRPATSRFT